MALSLPKLNGQKILITGGLGFIGSNLAHKCLELGAEVTIYDSLDTRSGGNRYNISGIEDSLQLLLRDVRDYESLSSAIQGQDVVFHCAAHTSHSNGVKEPLLNIEINCQGTIHVLEAVRHFSPGAKFVYLGTSTQVGKMVYQPIDELHPEFPVDIYSANKAAGENYTLIYASAHGLRTTALRFGNVFGPRAHIKTPSFGFINYFFGLGLQDKQITVFGEGSQLRNINYVDDCVSALILASQSEATNGQAYFAVSDQQYSVLQIAQTVSECVGGSVKLLPWPREFAAIEVGDAVITNKKLKQTIPWETEWNLQCGLGVMADYFRSRKEEYL